MKSPNFTYCRAKSIPEVFELMDYYGEDARILAGGQSLMPTLNMRLSSPTALIDINHISELKNIQEQSLGLSIGALVRHYQVETSEVVAKHIPLLHEALPHVAHSAIRSRGTFGGSLAFADPAAEIPAITLALEGVIHICAKTGERQIAALDFFHGLYSTALEHGEIITKVLFPKNTYSHFVFKELTRRHGDYATVGIAIAAEFQGTQLIKMRIIYFGVSDRPIVDNHLSLGLMNSRFDQENILKIAKFAGQEMDISSDIYHDVEIKRHLLKVIVKRALLDLLGKVSNGTI